MIRRSLLVLVETLLACLVPLVGHAAVFGPDDRQAYADVDVELRAAVLDATGSITCLDGAMGTGFLVDVSDYVQSPPDFYVVATAARVLYDERTGESRGRCAFQPARARGTYMELVDHLVGGSKLGPIDGNDWAFAKVEKRARTHRPLRVVFGNTYDFGPAYQLDLVAVGFVHEWGSVAMASDCFLDDKARYPGLWRLKDDIRYMIIHDCDFMRSARGGPLLLRNADGFQVIALNVGDGRMDKNEKLYGVPYDPQREFHNYSRRYDKDLEQKLIAFVSRFAHVKNPSVNIAARTELVQKVQSHLNRLGYDSGPSDGLVGFKTREAIKAFQITLGITPTGRVSEELLLLLQTK